MTFMFDPAKGLEALRALEKQWGGTAQERLSRKYAAYAAAAGETVPPPAPTRSEEIFDRVEAEARAAARQSEAIADAPVTPRPEANPVSAPRATAGSPPPTEPSPAPPPPSAVGQ